MKIFKASSTISPQLVEYIGSGMWRVRWGISSKELLELNESTTLYEYIEAEFNYKPTLEEIKNVILDYYNQEIDNTILSGFVWNDMAVWLSTENQFNYKAAYDVAVQTDGASLPVTFKFGTTETPVYHTFTELSDISDFYLKALAYVNLVLSNGWDTKDKIDFSVYSEFLDL